MPVRRPATHTNSMVTGTQPAHSSIATVTTSSTSESKTMDTETYSVDDRQNQDRIRRERFRSRLEARGIGS